MIGRILWLGGVLALITVAIVNQFDLARLHPPAPIEISGEPTDPVMRAEARFAPIRAELRQRGITGLTGYFSDAPSSQLGSTARGIERYFQAQFALAPLILEVDRRTDWIVADFERPASRSRIPSGWAIAADCNHGVLLLRRQP